MQVGWRRRCRGRPARPVSIGPGLRFAKPG
jgi:hypothetical protein